MNLYIEYTAIQIVRGIYTQSFRKKIKMDVEQNNIQITIHIHINIQSQNYIYIYTYVQSCTKKAVSYLYTCNTLVQRIISGRQLRGTDSNENRFDRVFETRRCYISIKIQTFPPPHFLMKYSTIIYYDAQQSVFFFYF